MPHLTVLDHRDAFVKALQAERAAGCHIGLVPTMGSLHRGHLSLMARAVSECDVVAVTVFVNPLQFGAGEDLAAYPRDPDGDRVKAESAGVGYLFAPSYKEMFPEPPFTAVAVGPLGQILEGACRPGHFQGVATIVTKLLSLAGSCRAYFGEKDYQQLAVIRRIVADLSLPAEIVACPIVRDPDGVALSSRNAYLSEAERAVAPTLYEALLAGRRATGVDAMKAAMVDTIARHPELTLDYAEVADPATLEPLVTIAAHQDARLLIAARLGRTRLIDNIGLREQG